jgi:Acetyltransferase (GNAT) domain
MAQLRFRMASREDTPAIVALMNATFRTPIDGPTWEWYVYGNPLGPSQVYLALEPQSDALVGAIGFNPTRLRIGSETILGDYAHHLALKPVYRDTLSYLALLRYSLQAQACGPTALAIGPPNRTAYPIHKTLTRWVDFGFLDCLRKLSPQGRPHNCRQLKAFDDQFDDFYARVSKNFSFCVEKTAAWANWRLFQRPGSPYTVYADCSGGEFRGYVVLKRWREPDGYTKAHILDLHALEEDTLSQLIAASECYAQGADELNLWAVQGYPYRASLEAMGFSASHRQPLIARSYNGLSPAYPGGDCSLSYGDGDTQY